MSTMPVRAFGTMLPAIVLWHGLVAAAPSRDWSQTAARTAIGSFVQGNPAAKVKIVEYLSFTCPHCAKLEGEAIGPLTAKYIRSGKASYEARQALRDPFDLAASLLARCGGPAFYFRVAPAIFAQQDSWVGKAIKWAATKPDMTGKSSAQQLQAMAVAAGLDRLFAAHGLPAARMQACLADTKEQDRLAAAAQAMWAVPGFPGTPAFVINGKPFGAIASWPDLEAQVTAALR